MKFPHPTRATCARFGLLFAQICIVTFSVFLFVLGVGLFVTRCQQ